MPGSNRLRELPRAVALTLSLLVTALVASGCMRVHTSLSLTDNDHVSGTLIAATLPLSAADSGPKLTVPDNLSNRVTETVYKADGYVGTELSLNGLTFDQLAQLASAVSNQSSHFQLTMHRSGNLVSVSGSVDLTQLPAQQADVKLQISFPGTVTQTDGSTGAQNTVTWSPPGGQLTTFSATAQYTPAGATHSWSFWVLMLGLAGAIVAGFVVLLALWARRRNIRKEQAFG